MVFAAFGSTDTVHRKTKDRKNGSHPPARDTIPHSVENLTYPVIRAPNQPPNDEAPVVAAAKPSPLDEMNQYVSAVRLLEILWDEASRPTLRWLRTQQKRQTIPFICVGRRIWFRPCQVIEHWGAARLLHVRVKLPPSA
jgi:hypothetical protein